MEIQICGDSDIFHSACLLCGWSTRGFILTQQACSPLCLIKTLKRPQITWMHSRHKAKSLTCLQIRIPWTQLPRFYFVFYSLQAPGLSVCIYHSPPVILLCSSPWVTNFEVWFWYYFLFFWLLPNVEDYITGHHFKLCRLLCSLNIVPWQTDRDVGQRSFLLRSWLLLWSKPWRNWIQRGLKKAIFSWEHLLPTSENRKYALEFLIYIGWKCVCSRWWVLDKCFWSVANAW